MPSLSIKYDIWGERENKKKVQRQHHRTTMEQQSYEQRRKKIIPTIILLIKIYDSTGGNPINKETVYYIAKRVYMAVLCMAYAIKCSCGCVFCQLCADFCVYV